MGENKYNRDNLNCILDALKYLQYKHLLEHLAKLITLMTETFCIVFQDKNKAGLDTLSGAIFFCGYCSNIFAKHTIAQWNYL